MINHGYQYWVLGHVHAREVVYDQGPYIVFPGNLQGRTIRETGTKGATIVTVRDGQVVEMDHRPLDVLRWALIEVDATESGDLGEVLAALRTELETTLDAAEGRTVAVRVRFTGVSAAHDEIVRDRETLREAVRSLASDVSDRLWIEKVEAATRPVLDRAALRDRDDAIGELLVDKI
ncbi:MAG: hypothetical protein IH626_00510 [Rhodospirillales bacterium]|nr:hypothetical protein [Rhodospirillales bacterium]